MRRSLYNQLLERVQEKRRFIQVWDQIRRDLGSEARQVGTLLFYSPEKADAVIEEEG